MSGSTEAKTGGEGKSKTVTWAEILGMRYNQPSDARRKRGATVLSQSLLSGAGCYLRCPSLSRR